MRHVNVKLEDADWEAFKALHEALQKRRRHPLTHSSTLRLVIKAGVEAREAVMAKAAAAPIVPPATPKDRWRKHVAKKVRDDAQVADERKNLHRRFECRCERENLNPHAFIELITRLDGRLKPEELHAWYFRGTVPADEDAGARLIRAISLWLESAQRPRARCEGDANGRRRT